MSVMAGLVPPGHLSRSLTNSQFITLLITTCDVESEDHTPAFAYRNVMEYLRGGRPISQP
jgi:hypothetical protein